MGLWGELEKLKGCTWVELSHPLNNDSPYWGGMPEGVLALNETVMDYDSEVLSCRIQTFKFPGQFGTHIDFPAHFSAGKATSEVFGVKDMVFPLCVIDISEKAIENPDYELTLDDIAAYEDQYGPIPEGAFVALRSDWYKRWPDNDALGNLDAEGNEHCPGWTVGTLKYLFEEKHVAGNGHETLDTDASIGYGVAGDLVAERYVLDSGKIQIEALANLDKVPASGALIFIAFPRIEGATGLPVRAWAIAE